MLDLIINCCLLLLLIMGFFGVALALINWFMITLDCYYDFREKHKGGNNG